MRLPGVIYRFFFFMRKGEQRGCAVGVGLASERKGLSISIFHRSACTSNTRLFSTGLPCRLARTCHATAKTMLRPPAEHMPGCHAVWHFLQDHYAPSTDKERGYVHRVDCASLGIVCAGGREAFVGFSACMAIIQKNTLAGKAGAGSGRPLDMKTSLFIDSM